MTKDIKIVVGAGFGDEGKGAFVNYLCSITERPLVIRFNGGHQVGHTVVADGKRHVFSNFGSGTLQGTPTYWSRFCTVSPTGLLKEGKVLREMGIDPVIYFDLNAIITTPFDILRNIANDDTTKHGSVGVGFGQTIQRNDDHYHLYVRDLLYPEIRDAKLQNIINKYYRHNFNPKDEHQNATTRKIYNDFLIACDELVERYDFMYNLNGFNDHDLIFEGGQGIMLDTDYGFFPNVTRSNCTTKNALELIKKLPFETYVDTYYITRAYQTRHGNGHMTNEDLDNSHIIENPNETNVSKGFQGKFRKTVLDLDLLKYAVSCDSYENPKTSRNMVVTCLDQVPARIPVTMSGKLIEVDWTDIPRHCGIRFKYGSWSENGYDDMRIDGYDTDMQ
jgi:adenylosuccinate synthase